MIHTISVPLYIELPRKTMAPKRYHLNLNVYRNLHYQVNNNLKKAYKKIVEPMLKGTCFSTPLKLTLVLYPPDKRRRDRSNVLVVQEKFFMDALVELGHIPDDNDNYVVSTTYLSGEVDKENPRVDIIIEEI